MPSANPPPQPQPHTSPSPSPPPQPPTALSPGPRATAFITLYNSALDSTLSSISYPSFSSCFPVISTQADSALRGMHHGMISRLREFAREEFEVIMQERGVVEKLNGLEDVIGDARRRRGRALDGGEGEGDGEVPVAPHTLPPAPLLQSHTLPLHIAQNSQLNARLQTTQSQNATLVEEIRRQREEIEVLLGCVERAVGDVGMAGSVLGEKGNGVEELSAEGRGAGEILSGGGV